MRRFKFSLESVFLIKQKALEDERIKLASIMNIYNKQNDGLKQMLSELSAINTQSEKYLTMGYFNPDIIANYSSFSNKLTQDIKTQELIIKKTAQELNHQQEIAKKAYIELKTLEKLKEKQKQQYDREFLQEEFKQIDDIVNSRRTA